VDLGLRDRVAIVTGASRGIGAATARMLAADGAAVVLCARDEVQLNSAVAELRTEGAAAIGIAGDVVDVATTAQIVETALAAFGRIDILVNNAGGESGRLGFDDLSDADWERSYLLNVVAPTRLIRAVLPSMRQLGWGRVINVASYTARVPEPFCLPYSAAKAAIVSLTRGLSRTCATEGILVNSVLPGLTATDGVVERFAEAAAESGRSTDDLLTAMLRRAPIDAGRMGTPDEVAALIVFLASAQASWISGSAFSVDGGTVRSAP
jgi:3-oxoacyl-[acyl-carrier protein] reductase